MHDTQIYTGGMNKIIQNVGISVNGWIYMEIRRGMTGLKQAVKIAQDRINNHIENVYYFSYQRTPSVLIHKTQLISFKQVVHNFGIKYSVKHHAQHIINRLQKKIRHYYVLHWGGLSRIENIL